MVAGVFDLALVADAALVDQLFTSHACAIVTLFDTLVSTAGQEPFA